MFYGKEDKDMGKSMKDKLIDNLGLKVIALLFAVVLWLLVVNINDPIESRTFSNIKVNVLHEEKIRQRHGRCSIIQTA